MNREVHVRFCEEQGVKSPLLTLLCVRYSFFVVNFHFFSPPIRNSNPIVNATNEYVVSVIEFVP